MWWLLLVQGSPTNVCLDGALVLQAAYAQFGIIAEPKLVVLTVHDQATGRTTEYGSTAPRFEGPHLVGHMGLWLPASGRFIDHSVQQFPEVRADDWLPVAAPIAEAGLSEWGHAGIQVLRRGLILEYIPLPEEDNVRILRHPPLIEFATKHYRAGVNLASNFLQMLRIDDLRNKAMAAPHPRLHALLEVIGDVEVVPNQHNLRFLMHGTEGRGGVYLDEIMVQPSDSR